MIQHGVLRIVCISDTHGFHRKLALPPGDILIHAGDCLPDDRQVEVLEDFNDWLGGLPFKHRIVVAGNHDLFFARQPQQARKRLTRATYLENTGVTIEGLNVWGCPVTPVPDHMAFAVERGAASRKYWDRVPPNTDVLITHGPPFRVLDTEDILGPHVGCDQLTRALLRARPRLHVFGHVHGSYGQEAGPHGIAFVNCAVLARLRDGRLGLREPIVVELEDRSCSLGE
jgi:Icc-related predicted phosphoesterase